MSLKIELYVQPRPVDWLRDNPEQKWRCDIYPGDFRTDHHGVGATEAEALLRAAQHWHQYELAKRSNKT